MLQCQVPPPQAAAFFVFFVFALPFLPAFAVVSAF